MNYYNRIGTRAECSPAIAGVALLVIMAFLIYHFRRAIELALIYTALAVLAGLVIYAVVAVTVAHRRHVAATTVQAVPDPMPAPAAPAVPVDLTDQLPPRADERQPLLPPRELADLHAVTGVNADGTIS